MAEAEINKVRDDLRKLLSDVRGTIDEAIVQLDLGEKDVRDVIRPVLDTAQNRWDEVRKRLGI